MHLGLGLSTVVSQRQTFQQICSICGQNMNGDPNNEDVLIEYLNSCEGKDMKYRLCPMCYQSVDPAHWTPTYKRKWTKRAKELVRKQAKIPLGPYVKIFEWDPLKEDKETKEISERFKKIIAAYGEGWQI